MPTDEKPQGPSPADATASPDANAGSAAAPPGTSAPATALPWDQAEQMMKALGAAWREATDHETPTLLQLLQAGVKRVDVDAVSGYLAVVAEEDTHRVIGIRRDLVAPLAAVFTRRSVADVSAQLAKGPAKIEAAAPAPPSPRARRAPG